MLVRYRLSVRTGCGARRAAGVPSWKWPIWRKAEHRDGVKRRRVQPAFAAALRFEHDAMLVYQVNGQELASATDGSSMQLWMPETVARYFTRNITDIELTREDAEPDVQQVDPCYRNKINIMNYADGCTFVAGDEITFEGVADDLGSPIEAIGAFRSTAALLGRRARPREQPRTNG